MRRRIATELGIVLSLLGFLSGWIEAEPNQAVNPILTESHKQWLADHPNLRIGFTAIPPQVFYDPATKTLSGLCIDYLHAVEKKLGYRFEKTYYPTWDEMMQAAFRGDLDVIYAAQKTPMREESFLFTQPYLEFENMIVTTRKIHGTLRMRDLFGKKVATVQGAALQEDIARLYPSIELMPVEDELRGLLLVSFSEADAMVIEPSRAGHIIDDKGINNLRVAGPTGLYFRLCYMVRKDMPELCDILNTGLAAIGPQQRQAMTNQWIRIHLPADLRYLWWILGGLAVSVVVIIFLNMSLRSQVRRRTRELQNELHRRELAEQERNYIEEQFRHVIEFCPLGVLIYHLAEDGRLILKGANTAAEKILKTDLRPLLGKRMEDAFPALAKTDIPERYRRICVNGIPWGVEEQPYGNGVIQGTFQVYAFQTAPGRLAVMFSDVSERIEAQAALRRSEAQLASLFRAAPAGLGLVTNRVFCQVNERFCQMLGFTSEELIGQNTRMIYADDEEYQHVGDQWYKQIESEGLGVVRTTFQHKDGHHVEILLTASAVEPQDISRGISFAALDITDYVHVSQELTESEARLSSVFRAAPAGIGVVVNRVFVQVNDYVCRMLGYAREELLGQNSRMVYPSQEEYERVGSEKYAQIRLTGAGTIQTQWKTKDGRILDVLLNSAALDPQDLPKGSAFTALDITERIAAQRQLEESQRLLDGIFQTAPVGLFLLDKDKRYVKVNRHLAQLNGISMERHLGHTVEEIFPAVASHIDLLWPAVFEQADAVFNHLIEFVKGPENPRTVYAMMNVYPYRGPDDEVIGMLGSVVNVTDIKQTEVALAESQRQLSTLLGNLPGIAFRCKNDPGWTIEFISKGCLELSGYTDEEFQSGTLSWNDVICPDDCQYVWDEIQKALAQRAVYRIEYRIQTRDGQSKWVWEQGCGIFNDAGQVVALEGLIIDISVRKKIKQTLELTQRTVDYAVDAIYWFNQDRQIVYINDAACRLLGYNRDELLKMKIEDIDARYQVNDWPAFWEEIKVQRTRHAETLHRRKEGGVLPLEISSFFMEYEGRQLVCAYARDISDRKKYQDALDVFIRSVASHSGKAMLEDFVQQIAGLLGADYVMLGRLTDLEQGLVEGLAVWAQGELVEPFTWMLDDTPCAQIRTQCMCTIADQVSDLYPKDTMLKTFGIRGYIGVPILDTHQVPVGLIKVLFRKSIEDARFYESILRIFANQISMEFQRMESQRLLQFIQFAVEHVGESAYWMDSDGKFVYVNDAACRELGYSREELLTRSVVDIDPNFDLERFRMHWQQLRDKGSDRFESHHKTRDGHVFPVEISANHVEYDGKEYHCSFAHDISDRKRYQMAIDAFIRTVSTCTGQDMFRVFVEHLAEQLDADMAVIGRLSNAPEYQVQTLAVFKDGQPVENFSYPLAGTPCEQSVLSKDRLCVLNSLDQVLAGDHALIQQGFRAYIGTPLHNLKGELIGVVCSFFRRPLEDSQYQQSILKIYANQAAIEIQRLEAQVELANSEYRFREMFARMSNAVVILKAVDEGYDFEVVDVNPACQRVEKLTREQLVGRRMRDIFPAIEGHEAMEFAQRIWRTGQSEHLPMVFYRDERIVSWREGYGYRLPTGELVILYDDITERKRAEDAIQFNAERMQALLRLNQMTGASLREITNYALEEAVRLTRSRMGYLAFVNEEQTVLTIYSWSKEAVQKCRVDEKPIFYEAGKTGLWGEALRQRKPIITNDYTADNPFNKGLPEGHVPLNRHMNVPVIVGSRVVVIAGVGDKTDEYDQTDVQQLTLLMEGMWRLVERIEAHQASEKLMKEIQAKNEELESIVFVASHDLRSPLINIQGFAGELQKSCRELTVLLGRETISEKNSRVIRRLLDEDIPESIGFISAGTVKMDALVNGLLQIARIGTMQMHIESIDMNRLMANILKTVQYQMREYEIELRVESLPQCMGDWVHLNQVFSNLIDNAIKYRHPSRKAVIEVFAQSVDNRVIYMVKDNGIGIPVGHTDKIFEVFHRLNPAGPVKGEGLGLTIVRRILDRLDGKIRVDSTPDQGAAFIVELPGINQR
ncbi:MAG: PAS domain S-box protein [Sedimentisphaerales bacterium]|nr:PAS domain S-box protein [Sedimentisphaerales bacterium]